MNRSDFGSWYDFVKDWMRSGEMYDKGVASCVLDFANGKSGKYELSDQRCRVKTYCPLRGTIEEKCNGFEFYKELYNNTLKKSLRLIK